MAEAPRSWKVGAATITRVVEIETLGTLTWILPDATREAMREHAWLVPHFADSEGRAALSVQALVIESQGRRILVDTCVGNDKARPIPGWDRRQGPFLRDLEAAGFPADSIDTVLCTHLHVDHVGWNTRLEGDRWVPTFRRARYLFGREEYAYWTHLAEEEASAFGDVIGDSVRPVVDAGLADLVETDHAVNDEVRLDPTPGHTPGHVSVRVVSGGEEAVITGDLMHHPVQCSRPDWNSRADADAERAERTRRDFLARHADRPVLVLGTHFAGPTGGRIVRDGDAFRLDV